MCVCVCVCVLAVLVDVSVELLDLGVQLALRPVQALLLGGSLEPQGQAGLSQTQNTPVL